MRTIKRLTDAQWTFLTAVAKYAATPAKTAKLVGVSDASRRARQLRNIGLIAKVGNTRRFDVTNAGLLRLEERVESLRDSVRALSHEDAESADYEKRRRMLDDIMAVNEAIEHAERRALETKLSVFDSDQLEYEMQGVGAVISGYSLQHQQYGTIVKNAAGGVFDSRNTLSYTGMLSNHRNASNELARIANVPSLLEVFNA